MNPAKYGKGEHWLLVLEQGGVGGGGSVVELQFPGRFEVKRWQQAQCSM